MTKTTPQRYIDLREQSPVEFALAYVRAGWHVLPLHFISQDGKCTCGNATKNCRPGKHPFGRLVPHGLKDATVNPTKILDWWGPVTQLNPGIATGAKSGLTVIDVDPKHGGIESLIALEVELDVDLRDTLTVETPSGGLHLYFCYQGNDLRPSQGALGRGLDVRGEDSYVVAPPGNHIITGKLYRFKRQHKKLTKLPEELRARILQLQGSGGGRAIAQEAEMIPKGAQHYTLISLAGSMRTFGFDEEAIFLSIWQTNLARCEEPGSEDNIRQIVADAMKLPQRKDPASMMQTIVRQMPHVADLVEADILDDPRSSNGQVTSHDELDTGRMFEPLPEDIFDLLPDRLRQITEKLPANFERDLFLTGALAVLGAHCTNTILKYGGEWQGLNLYVCIVADAGGGKGKVRLARRLGEPLHDMMFATSQSARMQWEKLKAEGENDSPIPPPFRRFYIGGDASGAEIKEALHANPHFCIFETEIKTLVQALKMEWGAFKDIILKAWHGEPITVERKGMLPLNIKMPAMSICLTGTPGSFSSFIEDTEDGVFSRMIFYHFDIDPGFKDQFTSSNEDEIDVLIEHLAKDLPFLHSKLHSRQIPLYITIDRVDQLRIVRAGTLAMEALHHSGADMHLQANVRRAALVAYRIAGILSLFDVFFNDGDIANAKTVKCQPGYVTVGLKLAFTYLEHALKLSEMMRQGHAIFAERRHKLLAALPVGVFRTKRAYEIGLQMNIPPRTVDYYLRQYAQAGYISRIGKIGDWSRQQTASFASVPDFRAIIEGTI